MSIEQQGPIMFIGWYTYDQSGASTRYFMSNCAVSGDGCSGDIYYITGGAAPTAPWTGHGPVSPVGTGTLTFSDTNTGAFNFVLNGVPGSKNIVRMVFGTAIAPPAADYTALWWNPNEPGWGVFLTHQSTTIFAALYTYDASGNPVRYVASNCAVSGNGCTGTLYKTSGGSAPTVPWAGPITLTPVGTITFAFTGASNGTMSFTIDGQSGTKTISEMVFYTAPAATPSATAVGAPTGSATSATIGAAGGSMSTPDGKLAVTVPAGALAVDTAMSIQPITNMAHGKIGTAYRLTPDGQTFLTPITLAFTYTNEDLLGTAAEFFGAAFQTAAGYWQWAGNAAIEPASKTVRVSTSHFSDWSNVKGLQIRPAKKIVKPKGTVGLQVKVCYQIDDTASDLITLATDCDTDQGIVSNLSIDEWSVNGNVGGGGVFGAVVGSGATATYTAPQTAPTPATVAVSARVHNPNKPPSAKTLIVSNITIAEDSWTGTGSSASDAISATAEVIWTLESTDNNVATYRPTGTTSVQSLCNISPSTGTIDPVSSGVLIVDYNANPATYHGSGLALWMATWSCPPLPPFNNGVPAAFFGGSKGTLGVEAQGLVSSDGMTIEGSDINTSGPEPVTFNWKFIRDR